MCRIEQFDVVYPDGTRERRERLLNCPRGTRSQPCRHTEAVILRDHLASASDLRDRIQPHVVPIAPGGLESSHTPPRNREKRRSPIEGLALHFNLWNPFSSKKKEKKGKTRYYVVRDTRKQEPHPPVIPYHPPIPPPFETHVEPPVVIPIQPPDHHTTHRSHGHEPRRGGRGPTPVVIHQRREEDEDESPSPPEAIREHGRRIRSLSPHSRYEVEKEKIRQRELRQRERQEEIKRKEREARERAEHLERQHRREEERERQEQLRRERREFEQRQRAVEREARRQQAERDRQQAEMDREQARTIQEREDRARLRAADQAQQELEERIRRRQEDDRRRAASRDRDARHQDAERQRYARAQQANIPRPPRHHPFVHQNEGHLDRGDRFIHNAIREENLRRFERRAGRPREWYDDGALRRRNTIDGGQRWYDGQRWRR